jgi:hypothetical protein
MKIHQAFIRPQLSRGGVEVGLFPVPHSAEKPLPEDLPAVRAEIMDLAIKLYELKGGNMFRILAPMASLFLHRASLPAPPTPRDPYDAIFYLYKAF